MWGQNVFPGTAYISGMCSVKIC